MIIFILIFGLILRLISIGQSLWLDEATSALTTRMSLSDFFTKFMPGDFHPPLYYLTLRIWSMFFGSTEISLRSLSVLFGIATIYILYLLGKEILNKKAGVVAAILLTTSGLHIYYSQEARMYAMSTFLVTLLIFSFVKILKGRRAAKWYVLFALIMGLIGITDYLPLLIVPVFWIYGILEKKTLLWFKKLFMSHIILVVLAGFWLPIFIKQLTSGINVTTTSPSWVAVLGTFSIKDILLIPVKFGIGRVGFDNKFIYAGIVALIFLVFGFLIFKSRKQVNKIKIIYLWLLIPLGLALLVSIKLPVLNYFRFLFVLPAFYLVVSCGILGLSIKWQRLFLGLVIFINLITSLIYLTNQRFQRENWKGVVSFIESKKTNNSVVIFPANSQMEAYRYYAPKALIYSPEAIKKGFSTIWLLRYAQPISDPSDSTRNKIEGLGYKKINEFDFNGVGVWEYER